MTAAVGHPGKDMADVTVDAPGVVQGGVQGSIQGGARDHSKGDAQDWLSAIEKSRLTPRYYATVALMVAQEMFEFYDFFLVGYLVSVLAPGWHLTYGQSAMMLLSSGIGAIVGSLVGGRIADRSDARRSSGSADLFFRLALRDVR
jgi:putative MFS transporter